MTVLIGLMNLVVIGLLYLLYLLVDWRGTEFALGAFTGCMIYQVAHRLHYGRWFD